MAHNNDLLKEMGLSFLLSPYEPPTKRSAEREAENDRASRAHGRQHILHTNPLIYDGPQDPRLETDCQLVINCQLACQTNNPAQARHMRIMQPAQAAKNFLTGGMHALIMENPDGSKMCRSCLAAECIGRTNDYLIYKIGYLAVAGIRELMEFLDTLTLIYHQLNWCVIRTWSGLENLLQKLGQSKPRYGGWLRYSYNELAEKLPAIWEAYTEGGTKKDDGRDFLVRPPIGHQMSMEELPETIALFSDSMIAYTRSQTPPSPMEIGGLRQMVFYLWRAQHQQLGYVIPEINNLKYN